MKNHALKKVRRGFGCSCGQFEYIDMEQRNKKKKLADARAFWLLHHVPIGEQRHVLLSQ